MGSNKFVNMAVVIVAGLILGAGLLVLFPNKEKTQTGVKKGTGPVNPNNNYNISPQTTQRAKSSIIPSSTITNKKSQTTQKAILAAKPTTIKSIKPQTDYKNNFKSLDKALLTLGYTNNTSIDLAKVQIWFSFTGGKNTNVLAGSKDIQISKTSTVKAGQKNFEVSNIKAGEEKRLSFFLTSYAPGTVKIHAEIHSADGKIIPSNTATITVN